jgi:hypothetical protein
MGMLMVYLLVAVSRAVTSSRQLGCIGMEAKEVLVFPGKRVKVVLRPSSLMKDMTIRT